MIPLLALALATAAPVLRDADVRALVARQERAWNAGDVATWAATFSPDAKFISQARSNENTVVPYGTSTLAQARTQARGALAKGSGRGVSGPLRVTISPDGRTAYSLAYVVTRLPTRTSCAERTETFTLLRGRLVATGQVDTVVRCRR